MSSNKEIAFQYLDRLSTLLRYIDLNNLEDFADIFKSASSRNSTIFVMGNGGSAALASHFAADLGVGGLKLGTPSRVLSLNDCVPAITATANDFEYKYVFSKQLEYMSSPGDVVFCISSSGNSLNLVEATRYGIENKLITVGLLGFNGGKLLSLLQHSLLVQSQVGDYGPVEDAHSAVCHILAEILRKK